MADKDYSNPLKFPEVVVVEASAGSGKTYALAKRYLQLLINPNFTSKFIPLRNILAITFTNKATVEMKERILELLKKIVLDAFSDKDEEKEILSALQLDKQSAQEKAYMVMDELIRHYNFFQVQTIDSFINALLLGSALNIDRSASFKIKRNYLQYLSYCLDLVIEDALPGTETLEFLEEFLRHYLFVENRSGWFPKEDILGLVQSLFRLSNNYGKRFEIYAGESKDIIKKKKNIFKQIEELASKFPEGMNKTACKSIENFIQKSNSIFEIKDLPDKFQKKSAPMNKGKKCLPEYEKKWKKIHNQIRELVNLEATTIYNPYIKLFQNLLTFFQDLSKKEDVLFLEELNRKARLLFDEGAMTVAESYYRLATRFQHYLIDEFQDTSVLQWRNLFIMVEEALSSGGSLFYVGDKKQAIYRFRGGQSSLFDEVKSDFSHFNVKLESLNKNWRSQKEIVEFNNKIFSKNNLTRTLGLSGIAQELIGEPGSFQEIVDIFKDALQQYREENNSGYVRIERIDEKNQEQRDELVEPKILKLIEELKARGFSYEDIAILTRDNREVELVTSWLLKSHLAVESEKTLNVIENSLIKEIISFLTFLHSPIDNLSFASFILGDIFSRATGISNKEITTFLFNLRKEKKDEGISLYRYFRKTYKKIWDDYIDEFFRIVGFVSPYELTTAIYERFKVYSNFKETQAFFMKFLELVKTREDDFTSLGEFLAYLKEAPQDDLYVNVAHSDSIKILTIHKSKGLEFPVVIIPFLRIDITPETAGKGTSSYVMEDQNQNLGLVRITKDYRPYSDILQKEYSQSYKKSCIDELNNIYVALTRPQFELYIFIPKKSGPSSNKVRFLIPEELGEKGIKQEYKKQARDSQALISFGASSYKNWIGYLKNEFSDIDIGLKHEQVLEGNIFHAMLSQVGDCTNKDIAVLLKNCLKYAQIKFPQLRDSRAYKEKVKKILENNDFKSIFYAQGASVYCEKEVANQFGDLKRIDRLIVKEREVWVVDYKSSQLNKDEQHKQIKEYIQIVKDIYPQRKVKGFILYLDKLKIEEVFGK